MARSSSRGNCEKTSDDVSLQDVTTSVPDRIPRGSAAHHFNTTSPGSDENYATSRGGVNCLAARV
jgi:hypothetical protein